MEFVRISFFRAVRTGADRWQFPPRAGVDAVVKEFAVANSSATSNETHYYCHHDVSSEWD